MAVLNFLGYANLWDVPKDGVIIVFIGTTVVIAVGYVVLWYYYQGWKWARLAVILTSLVILPNNYWAIENRVKNPVLKVVDIAEMMVAVFLLVWLNTSTAKVYFKRTDHGQLA